MLKEIANRSVPERSRMPAKSGPTDFEYMLLDPTGEDSLGMGSGSRPVIHNHRHNLRSRFELLKTLGQGTYGKVKLAIEKSTGEEVAIKYIKKTKIQDENDLNRIRREIHIMSSLRHPHVVNVREVFENKDKIILVMDCATGGELYDYINDNHLTEKEARRVFRQIVSAISYCHQNGIVHRDLKLENILLDQDKHAKIADFGLSNYYSSNDLLKTFCGSPLYASPEIVTGSPYHGPEVDCWSLGVVLYTLVYGIMPFDGSNFKKLRSQITSGDYFEPSQPSEAAGLIRHLLTVNPSKRATMSDILSHWWVNLGFREMPNDQPYVCPVVLQPVPNCRSQNSSTSSDSSDGETDTAEKPKIPGPLKGILKKPKMMDTRSQEMTNDNRSPLSDFVQSSADTADKEVNGSENVFNGQANCDTSEAEAETEAGLEPGSPPTSASDSVFSSEANGKKIFDAQRMPARSILKRKGKFSTGDSGCDLTEASRRNSANLTTKSNPADQPEIDSAIDSPDGSHINAANVTTDGNSLNHGAFNFVVDDSATVMTSETATYDITVVPRRRGILKNRSKEEADKRLSTCSGGSNSSADILDFSYDSCDDLLSLKYYRQPSPMLLSDNEEMRDVSTTEAESGIHPDFFSLEAQKVYKQALDICKNF